MIAAMVPTLGLIPFPGGKFAMAKEREAYEDRGDNEDRSGATLLASETLRNAANRVVRTDQPKGEEGISMFWRVFGGTILSIVALVIITAYTTMTGTMSDLRKDLNQVQADQLKKDEFNNRLTAMWSSIKDLQTANNTLVALNERFKLIDQQMNKQAKGGDDDRKKMQRRFEEQRKAGEDERKELQKKVDDLNQKLQTLAERLATVEGRQGTPSVPVFTK
jgi:hypothetical protein